MKKIAKRKVLVTGAGSGIGLACTQKFLKNGWQVWAHYHKTDASLKKLLSKYGEQTLVLRKADFGKASELEDFLTCVKEESFDALVNNAAVYDFSLKYKNRVKAINEVLMVNTVAPTFLAEAVFDQMIKKNRGHIVNISTIAARYGSCRENVFYGISKRGMEAISRTLARQGAPHNVCVNTVRPGVVSTSFHDKIGRDMTKRKELIPMKRFVEAKEIADLVYYLCMENTFMTSQTLTISGGE